MPTTPRRTLAETPRRVIELAPTEYIATLAASMASTAIAARSAALGRRLDRAIAEASAVVPDSPERIQADLLALADPRHELPVDEERAARLALARRTAAWARTELTNVLKETTR
jgi:hypothetical protein